MCNTMTTTLNFKAAANELASPTANQGNIMRAIIASVLLALSCSANAGAITGNDYLTMRKDDASSATFIVYGMFVALDAYSPQVCFAEGVTVGQTADMMVSFMQKFPDIRNKSIAIIYGELMKSAYPCKLPAQPTQPSQPTM